MSRKNTNIRVIIHDTDENSEKVSQEAVDALYIKIIVDKLSSSGLTYAEQREVLKRVVNNILPGGEQHRNLEINKEVFV